MFNQRLWQNFQELAAIYSPTFKEQAFASALRAKLTAMGIASTEDNAGLKIGGNAGNLFASIDGDLDKEPLLFSAHMDTVEPARGKAAVLHPDGRITSQGNTILGADDISGIVAILEALTRLKEEGIPHRPLELLFPVAEESYCLGSAVFDYSRLRAKQAYVLDISGPIGTAAYAAPTLLSLKITVHGRASHAGFAPNNGIHAIESAARAIARLKQGEPKSGLTFNLGRISGGDATNIVPALCEIFGEIRSLDNQAVLDYWAHVKQVFEDELAPSGAVLETEEAIKITAYRTPLDSPVATRYRHACEEEKLEVQFRETLGGSDQNNFSLHGINGLVIACGMHEAHSNREYSNIHEMEACVKLLMRLMTDTSTD